MGWIILALYIVGWAGFSVTIARFMQKDSFMRADDQFGEVLNVVLAMFAALFWPLVIPGGWVYVRVFGNNKKGEAE